MASSIVSVLDVKAGRLAGSPLRAEEAPGPQGSYIAGSQMICPRGQEGLDGQYR